VPISSAGRAVGVKTDIIDALINWASIIFGRDFRAEGRNEHLIDFASFLK